MTDAQILERLRDPQYFIERFFHIVDKSRMRVPFRFNLPQTRYYGAKTNFDLILKARKEGFSSLIEALWLHACMFGQYVRAVTMSHEMESTKRHFDRVRYFLENMGVKERKFEIELDEESQKQITFSGSQSSYWIGTAGAKAFGRGDDITHLHLSEVAHYDNQEVLTGALEACVPKAMRVMETTANGVGEAFHKLWQEAKDSKSESKWHPHFFSWFEDPTNRLPLPQHINFRMSSAEQAMQKQFNLDLEQINWYRNKRAEMPDKGKMPQEYPSTDQEAFLSSGRPCFDQKRLAQMLEVLDGQVEETGDLRNDGQKVEFRPSTDGVLTIWRRPSRIGSYLISADTAQGVTGGNFSVADVYDRANGSQIAQMRLRTDPGTWGHMLVDLALFYNNAALLPENNSIGRAAIEAIISRHYPHLVRCKEVMPAKRGTDMGEDYGFPTSDTRNYDGPRSLAITALRNAVDDGTHYIHSKTTISEMQTFVQNADNGKWEAMEGCQDDCVLTAAIGVYALKFLTVDETYADQASQRRGSPILTQSIVGGHNTGDRKKSATGYR